MIIKVRKIVEEEVEVVQPAIVAAHSPEQLHPCYMVYSRDISQEQARELGEGFREWLYCNSTVTFFDALQRNSPRKPFPKIAAVKALREKMQELGEAKLLFYTAEDSSEYKYTPTLKACKELVEAIMVANGLE